MRKSICLFLLFCMAAALFCGVQAQAVAVVGECVDINGIAYRPNGEAGHLYENDGVRLFIPLDYDELVYVTLPENDEHGVLFGVAEKASVDAAKASRDYYEGAGYLFALARVTQEELNALRCDYMTGQKVIAKDEDGNCYLYHHPTDVRYVRESYEGAGDENNEDWMNWVSLNVWRRKELASSFIAENSGFSALSYGNSTLDILLARAAYAPDTHYTLSTLEAGPLAPEGVEAAPYVERLSQGLTLRRIDSGEAPDGEYAVLSFPDEGYRFDFFFMPGKENCIREIDRDGRELIYLAEYEDESLLASAVVQEWYDALAEAGNA